MHLVSTEIIFHIGRKNMRVKQNENKNKIENFLENKSNKQKIIDKLWHIQVSMQ